MKRIPIGIENFKELIDKKFYYVDKTLFIENVLKEKVALYARPRRFGKTLNMSMLYYFFSIQQADNAYLFKDLEISKNEEAMQYQNQYPVIFMSLKDMKDLSFPNQLDNFQIILSEIISKNEVLFTSEYLDEMDRNLLKAYKIGTVNKAQLQNGLRFICNCLEKHWKNKVILLIDEYDVPLQSAYLNGYYDEMVDFISKVFSSALKTNDALEKGILTGCLRIAKESIFTGLNNFNVRSIFDTESNQYFGFKPEETMKMLENYDLQLYEHTTKEWYDGYLFGNQEIYNPWSVLMYAQKILQNNPEPESFWANTSGNDIIYRYIQLGNEEMKQDFDLLTSGKFIEKIIKPELTYREMDDTENIYSFMLFTGYLKPVKRTKMNTYQIAIPNKEVRYIFTSIFEEWFRQRIKENNIGFIDAVFKEDVENANEIMNTVLFQSMSYFDYDEKYYHGFLNGMLQGITNCRISSNAESGLGRFDLAILPAYNKKRGLVFEIKVAKSIEELENTAELACQQIKDMKYIEGLNKKGYTDIVGYGIAFYKKSCVIAKTE